MPPLVPPPEGAPRRSLLQAVASAVALLALVAVAYALGVQALFVLVCAVVLLGLFELLTALRTHGRRPVMALGLAAALGLLVAAYAGRAVLLLVVLAGLVIGALLLALRPARGDTPAADAAWLLLGVGWIGGAGAGAVAILRLEPGGRALLVAYVLVVAMADTAAYFTGSRVGRRKLAPAVSPAKSWEGALGGLVGALLAGAAAGALLDELSWAEGAGMGLVCGLLAPLGDLVESLVKREIGIKDSGGLLPGHGGFLDRLDAILFCALPVLAYVRVVAV